jgi:hypothetical protein
MSTSTLPQRAPQHVPSPEQERESVTLSRPDEPRRRAPHERDPTYGSQIGSEPYDDPMQGITIGSDPYDDPTRGRL